jgi:ubiquinone/menaquinone biosynthesis C-methylase UbiE
MPAPIRQSDSSAKQNASYFRDYLESYRAQVASLDTYQNIRLYTDEAVTGIGRLLDVGNGGTFDYDVARVRELVAVDLFLESLPAAACPPNVVLKNGSALDLPEPDASFDGVIMVMLLHHLIGKSVRESVANISRAITEALRVLKPGGKLIVVESCVPRWFYGVERFVFPAASRLIGLMIDHPATLQFPPGVIAGILKSHAGSVAVTRIPKGRWVLQYGVKFPARLTPAAPYRFLCRKENPE